MVVDMEKIFYTRRKGDMSSIRQFLTVTTDGKQYHLHFLLLDRTKPTKAERAAGAKAERFEILNREYVINCGDFIRASDYPVPKLVREFIKFLKEPKHNDN